MALHQYTVTMTGAAQRLLPSGHQTVMQISVENETGNDVVKLGTSAVTSTDYGRSVLAGPAYAVTYGPYSSWPITLEEIYALGTNNQKIHVMVVA